MEIPLYLAMTAAEFTFCPQPPEKMAWMACHFSPYGTGLSNCPPDLPEGSLIILNDRTPICGHDPQRIAGQLNSLIGEFLPCGILLDFQRSGNEETAHLAAFLTDALPCPVGVSDVYAGELDCPVFLPPPKPNRTLTDHLKPWMGREVWLEASLDSLCFTITEKGCKTRSCSTEVFPFHDDRLHCRYQIMLTDDSAQFTLNRNGDDLTALLAEAASLGVTRAVGLWQELNRQESSCPNARLSNP